MPKQRQKNSIDSSLMMRRSESPVDMLHATVLKLHAGISKIKGARHNKTLKRLMLYSKQAATLVELVRTNYVEFDSPERAEKLKHLLTAVSDIPLVGLELEKNNGNEFWLT